MARTADLFGEFLGALSAHLDDHELRGGDLAGQLFVSRSVLDRLVRANAGEPAARFRRRVLLERAAYRLRCTPADVLDVATEAGYSSAEAFSRAFSRAYGSPPATWRTTPGSIHVSSASAVHFYPPGGLRLPATPGGPQMNFVASLFDQHLAVLGQLLDRAAGLTDEQLDQPIVLSVQGIDDRPTIRTLLSRLVGQLDMWNAAMANRPYDFADPRTETIASMRERLASAGRSFAGYVRDASEHDRLAETFVDATSEQPYAFTAAGMIAHVLAYASYRRTLVVGALASAGAADVDDDPLTWFRP
jgi:AraC family transcriptional regulator